MSHFVSIFSLYFLPEIGHMALILALGLSILLSVSTKCLSLKNTKITVWAIFVVIAIAFACLTLAFLQNNFSVLYVASNSSTTLPWWYKVCAVWGAHEGSMLLWVFILSIWMSAVALFSKKLPDDFLQKTLAILGMLCFGFLLFILWTSNPFARLFPIPAQGQDLNPLLQDIGFLFHPPILYMGYVGLSVPFAVVLAALWTGNVQGSFQREVFQKRASMPSALPASESRRFSKPHAGSSPIATRATSTIWAGWARPWTLAAWCFLTIGITLGSWWAYRELGWGGFWFWDPVENASFMPWLVGTALIHSLQMTQKREQGIAWTAALAISSFLLSLLGTFLVRSGILTSVHSFALSPARGLFMLIFLIVVMVAAFIVYGVRMAQLYTKDKYNMWSRQGLFILNNILLTTVMLTVLLGTLYPLILQVMNNDTISVGAPYFNQMFGIFMTPVLFFMGFGPLTAWSPKPKILEDNDHYIKLLLCLCVALGFFIPKFCFPDFHIGAAFAIFLSAWIIIATFWSQRKHRHWGMIWAHVGMAVALLGIVLSSDYGIERNVIASVGDTISLSSYTLLFKDMKETKGPNYSALTSEFEIQKNHQSIGVIYPQKRYYPIQKTVMTEAAIHVGFFQDIYVALGNAAENSKKEAWIVRVYYKPCVRWIWAGGFLILLGGILAALKQVKKWLK